MKLILILLTATFSLSVFSENLKSKKDDGLKLPDSEGWVRAITASCIESGRRNNATAAVRSLDAGCACVAKNVLKLASYEESIQDAIEDLEWTKRYYAGGVSTPEVQKDPLAIVQLIFHFSAECAKSSNYEHNFGPGS